MSKKTNLTQINFRLTLDEKAEIESKAFSAGVSQSEYLRLIATHGFVIAPKELPEILRLLRYAGNNINQLARQAHQNHMPYAEDVDDIKNTVNEIKNLIDALVNKITCLHERR